MCFLISCLRSCWKENGNKLKTHTHTRNREPPDFEDEGTKITIFFDEILCYPKNQTEHFHKGTTCNHDPVTTQKETAFPNSCNTKSPTPPTAVLTAVMALSSLLWAAARSFRCWLLLFIAVLSSSAVCLTVSQTAQNQKLDPTILNSVSVKIHNLGLFVSSEQRLWSESGDSLLKDEVCNCPKDWLISVRQYAATAVQPQTT